MPRVGAALMCVKGHILISQAEAFVSAISNKQNTVKTKCHKCARAHMVDLDALPHNVKLVLCDDCRDGYSGGMMPLARASLGMLNNIKNQIQKNMLSKGFLGVDIPSLKKQ